LHPLEGSSIAIPSVLFNRKKQDLWPKAMTAALKVKNKLGFIQRAITMLNPKEGEDPSEFNAWEIVNSICSWIVDIIDLTLHTRLAYAETAQALSHL